MPVARPVLPAPVVAPAPATDPTASETLALAPAPILQPYGVVVRAHGRGGVYDIVVYGDSILVARSSGTDPVVVGAFLGALLASGVGAIIGAFTGDRIARRSAAKRLPELFYTTPEFVFGANRRNRFVRSADVRFARFVEYGARRRMLELRMLDGSRCRLRFDIGFAQNSFAREALSASLRTRMRIERHRFSTVSLVSRVAVVVAASAVSAAVLALLAAAIS